MENRNEIEEMIAGVIDGSVDPSQLQKILKVDFMPAILRNVAVELYRLQAIYMGAPEGHQYKKQAQERIPGMMRAIEALGGRTIAVDTDKPLLARYWVLDADQAPIPDNIVIDWQS